MFEAFEFIIGMVFIIIGTALLGALLVFSVIDFIDYMAKEKESGD